ncbi:MAG: hypothetical protein HYR48_06895 [Gemmatimonadetes bacterium]|nr:hypothetical protein [Gemmatimonadota bacterium]
MATGMALAQAQALVADLVALPWDDEKVSRAALDVTTALLAASPRVAWEGGPLRVCASARLPTADGVWWVDAAGLGEEKALARKLLSLARGLGYGEPRVGIADSAIAAYAATYDGDDLALVGVGPRLAAPRECSLRRGPATSSPVVAVVTPGTDAAFLAPFPLALLALDEELADTFAALGLRTVGQLAALEADEVEARFGPQGLAAHRLARGIDPRGPSTPRDDALPVIEVELGGPVATAEPLLFVLRGALASLGEALRARGLAARELALTLHLDDGSKAVRAVRPARPTSHADALFDHCRSALEKWHLPEPVTGLALGAAVTAPASGEQGNLLASRWVDPGALVAAFDRIRGSEGSDGVVVPQERDGHLPQDGGTWVETAMARGGAGVGRERRRPACGPPPRAHDTRPDDAPAAAAALRLLETPVPIRVRLGRGGLEAFRHEDVWHDVTDWCGPERLAPRWWDGRATGPPRDYYTARAAGGALWLLFRSPKERKWFVEGWWD